ncbi:cellulose biosynthesis protein BcsG [Caballeronia sp. LZ062]|uniref:cellulose biosynthesis protein BcsG n=1 Tax=unclassified Caballeronia TaxID=2646786 RepID=UPI002861F2F1|nr:MULTISPECIES: cellulose biosynthesis protein BcsG [unclassified Caballeronia]MDR5856200.1 cellulose biosynthesis protein BcsG [Caballeronia sp. LZ050]MDR5872871.1 cellulose biosynthesis protein BcsG [Caballeronia sp. LZ062]
MTFWNLYFILKLYLWATGHLSPLWLANLAFALALGATSFWRAYLARLARLLVALAIALPLMYTEAKVPPFSRLVSEFSAMLHFSAGYWYELAQRVLPPALLLTGICAVVGYLVVNRWLRVSTLVIAALITAPVYELGRAIQLPGNAVSPAGTSPAALSLAVRAGNAPGQTGASGHDAELAAFRTDEAKRRVSFAHLTSDANAQFDIILLHICSLSWNDLDVAKSRDHPMLSHFDYVFTNFSTAASYSGPAAVRVLRAACGQEPHQKLYEAADADCYLLSALARAGYTPQVLLNHDGHFGDFASTVARNVGAANVPFQPNGAAPVQMRSFDDSPIREDYGTLAGWLAQRGRVQGPVALYYNTISLHDGNRLPGIPGSSLETYPRRVQKLMTDFDRFADLVASSGRRAAIVFVPEHGAALAGDKDQIAGLREVPTPHIVHGPVGIRLVGFGGAHPPATVITQPSSFLALAQLLSNLVARSPFQPGATLPDYAANLPRTRMVGENEQTVTIGTAAGYSVRTPDGVWVDQQ